MQVLQAENENSDQTARMRRLSSLRWPHVSEGTFSRVAAQIFITTRNKMSCDMKLTGICLFSKS